MRAAERLSIEYMERRLLGPDTAAADELALLLQSGVSQILEALGGVTVQGTRPALSAAILKLAFTACNQIEAARSAAIAQLDDCSNESCQAALMSAVNCNDWLARTQHISSGAAHAQVQVARRLRTMPKVSAAHDEGLISGAHVGYIGRVVSMFEKADLCTSQIQDALVERSQAADPRESAPYEVYKYGLALLHERKPSELESEEERLRRCRHLYISESRWGGFELSGFLDPVSGSVVKQALSGLMGKPAKDDERTPGQRRADALTELCSGVLDSGDLPARGGVKPHITITADINTLCGNPGAPAALLDWGWPLSSAWLRRIADDAEITPIVLGPAGDPLHVGRRYRTANGKMRAALAERDRRCQWPGCERRPQECEGHHEDPWREGGRTDVDRMALLCKFHHRKLDVGWRLERCGHEVTVHPPEPPEPIFGPAVYEPD